MEKTLNPIIQFLAYSNKICIQLNSSTLYANPSTDDTKPAHSIWHPLQDKGMSSVDISRVADSRLKLCYPQLVKIS